MIDIKDRVARGAALLDREHPGWRRLIDLERLDMASHNFCILGQIWEDYTTGADVLELNDQSATEHGFLSYADSIFGDEEEATQDYRQLDEEWVNYLEG